MKTRKIRAAKQAGFVPMSVTLHPDVMARLDAMADSVREQFPGLSVSRASVVRRIILQWIEQQEALSQQPRHRAR